MVGNVESYESGWEASGKYDTLAKKIIESDEFTATEKLRLVRALDTKAAHENAPWVKDTCDGLPYIGPTVIYQTRGYDDGCDEKRYKLTC